MLPVSYFLGIWISGWEAPPDYIVQGASLNPLHSGAGPAVVWGWVLFRNTRTGLIRE
jgi:hypothetical protein